MISQFIHYLLWLATYIQDENGYFVAKVDWFQWCFSQWTTIEEARQNLKDAIEWVVTIKLTDGDKKLREQIKKFIETRSPVYA